MTPPVFVPQQTATETMADVMRALCEQIAEKQRQIEQDAQFHQSEKSRLKSELATLTREKATAERLREIEKQRADGVQVQFDALVAKQAESQRHAENQARNLARLDRITLDLYHYIVELSGHRDTARTKAERIALGHVVERLKEIRGMNEAEQAATS